MNDIDEIRKCVKELITDCRDSWAPDRPPYELAEFMDDIEEALAEKAP